MTDLFGVYTAMRATLFGVVPISNIRIHPSTEMLDYLGALKPGTSVGIDCPEDIFGKTAKRTYKKMGVALPPETVEYWEEVRRSAGSASLHYLRTPDIMRDYSRLILEERRAMDNMRMHMHETYGDAHARQDPADERARELRIRLWASGIRKDVFEIDEMTERIAAQAYILRLDVIVANVGVAEYMMRHPGSLGTVMYKRDTGHIA